MYFLPFLPLKAPKWHFPIVSQMSKCLKFKSIREDKNHCILCKITPRNVTNFRHLLSCDTTGESVKLVNGVLEISKAEMVRNTCFHIELVSVIYP